MTTVSTLVLTNPPWADFAFDALPVGTASCRILRFDAGAWVELPGAKARPVLGDEWRYLDHGLPVREVAAPISYRLEPLSAAGAILSAGVLEWTVTAPVVDHGDVWLSDPLNPLAAVKAAMSATGDEAQTWGASSGGLLTPLGGRPVSTGMQRQRQRPWHVETASDVDASAVLGMVDSGAVLLLRGDPACLVHDTGVVYLHVDGPRMRWVLVHDSRRWWDLPGTECRPPAILQLVANRTYADDLAEHATYAASTLAFPTYLDRVRGFVPGFGVSGFGTSPFGY